MKRSLLRLQRVTEVLYKQAKSELAASTMRLNVADNSYDSFSQMGDATAQALAGDSLADVLFSAELSRSGMDAMRHEISYATVERDARIGLKQEREIAFKQISRLVEKRRLIDKKQAHKKEQRELDDIAASRTGERGNGYGF